jgi:serine/threonine-protein kinase
VASPAAPPAAPPLQRGAVIALIAATALGFLGIVVWLAMRLSAEPPANTAPDSDSAPVAATDSAPGTNPATAPGTDSVAATDSAPAAATDSAPVAGTDSAPVAGTDSAPTRAPRPAPDRPSAPRSPAPSASGAATAPASSAPGTLQVVVLPWADVSVDGRPVGTTPIAPVTLPPGPHTVVLRNAELGAVRTVPVTIKSGQPMLLRIDLRRTESP